MCSVRVPSGKPGRATYTTVCVDQTSADGYGVVVDGLFNTDPADKTTANCVECPERNIYFTGGSGICRRDTDGDNIADIDDPDDDNDGVLDTQDTNSTNPLICQDTENDGDGCDDCSVTGQSASASVLLLPIPLMMVTISMKMTCAMVETQTLITMELCK